MIKTFFVCDRCGKSFELSNFTETPEYDVYTIETHSEYHAAQKKEICGECYNKLNLFLLKQETQERKE